jgi:hypothetical protein
VSAERNQRGKDPAGGVRDIGDSRSAKGTSPAHGPPRASRHMPTRLNSINLELKAELERKLGANKQAQNSSFHFKGFLVTDLAHILMLDVGTGSLRTR